MTTFRARRPVAILSVALALSVMLTGAAAPAPTSAASDRLPDLKVAKIRDLRIVRTASGRRLLRFTSMMWNSGAGPFEVRSSRKNTRTAWDVDQIVYDSAGRARRIETDATLRFAGDGHSHWHVRRMMSYHLWGSRGTLHDSKIGFCFFDTNLVDGSLPRSPSRARYHESTCGGRGALRTRNGISVGWGDKYPWNFAYQWIDISGLPGGTYTLRAAVDLYRQFTEVSDTNNCKWARIRFGKTGSRVTVLATGTSCVTDRTGSPYAADIAWVYEQGLTRGCDADMYCTNDPTSRGEMASFLARAMDLPASTTDHYDDDDGKAHEANINRVAEAGFAFRCGVRKYCSGSNVTRAVMAGMLARALALPPATADHYTDDDGTRHEAAINAVTEAGLSSGCAATRFCPGGSVTRGQMAAILHRAFGSQP